MLLKALPNGPKQQLLFHFLNGKESLKVVGHLPLCTTKFQILVCLTIASKADNRKLVGIKVNNGSEKMSMGKGSLKKL